MPKWAKVLIGVIVLMACACLATCGAGRLWWSRNRASMVAEGRQRTAEGRVFGGGRSAPECMREGARRLDECIGLLCEVHARIFAEGCMSASQVPADFCEGVPRTNEIMATVAWRQRYCEGTLGRPNDQRCMRFAESVQRQCYGAPRP